MRLLTRIDGSVLWLFKPNQTAENNLIKEAIKRGVSPDRLIFASRVPLSEHLARHRLADLFLDTFNYNAHATGSGSLWAGLPVLTKMGESFASRAGGSLLSAVELPELITTTIQEYEDTALRLATHPVELNALKEKLGHNLKTTTLFNPEIFTKHIEAAYTEMLRRLNENVEHDHIYVKN
jgi:predicted O-linked N-acetylglucosamine transferase (SPINDLY family)